APAAWAHDPAPFVRARAAPHPGHARHARRCHCKAAVRALHPIVLMHALSSALKFPHPRPPAPGAAIEVAPGILWVRLALPYRLDHVNVYLIEDGAGFAVLDTGLDDAATRAAWEGLLAGPLRARP